VFLLVPAHPGSPAQRAIKRLLLFVVECTGGYSDELLSRRHGNAAVSSTNALSSHQRVIACGFHPYRR